MSHPTRRSFVSDSIAALAAAGAAGVLPSRAPGQSPASERIQVGLVGVGGRAGALLDLFTRQEDVDIVSITDVDSRRVPGALAAIERISGRTPKVAPDFRHVVDDPQIDAVVVGTPDHWHAIPTILACQAAKDVYVEKPDGHNLLEGQRMVEAMRKHNRIVQLGTQGRSSPHFRPAIELAGSGKLGRVLFAKAWESARQGSLGHPPDTDPPQGVDYDLWLGPAPKRPFNPVRFHGNWRWFFDYGTGDLGNDGVHRIDIARWALGEAVRAETDSTMSVLPHRISAVGGKWYFDDVQEWPDTLQVTYEYSVADAASRVLTYEMRIWTPYPYMDESEGVVLYGDRGYLVIGNSRWRAYLPSGEVFAEGQGNNNGAEHVRNFLDCVKSREKPNADLETVGHPSSVTCHAGNIAWRTGTQLVLDPATETFDSAQANALRTRPKYRKPWTLPEIT